MKNEQIQELLKSTIKSKKIVNGYIFSGTGKTRNFEYAKEFAKMILCISEQKDNYCNKCKSCLMFIDDNHSDYYQINKDITESIKIDEIRGMQEKVFEKPIISNKKVYIINNAEQMTVESQNCLLKTLEEPPEFVSIILVTNNENNILTTIKSRCAKIAFTEETENEFTEEEKEAYENLEKIFGDISEYTSIDLLNKIDILYKEKENIFRNLEYINMILIKKAKTDTKYLEYIDYVEETKSKLKQNSNHDMCIDNLILKIWE
ncbi:MAG: DNA polymerase III subunit [Clostridia bacterium]|nr:DNA polymerase III subunit [Clostridia bacterium]